MYYIDAMIKKMVLSDFTPDNFIHYAECRFDQGHCANAHSHDFYEVFFIQSGTIIHDFNNQEQVLCKGHIQLIQPDDTHNLRCPDGMTCHLTNIAFNPSIIDNRLSDYLRELLIQSECLQALDCHPAVFNIILYYANLISTSDSTNRKGQYLYALLTDYLLAHKTVRTSNDLYAPQWLQKAASMIKEDKGFITGLSKFIQLSQRSQEHLTREMKRYYGQTPTAYINDLRLAYAAELLTHSTQDILSIVYECGFNNAAHFGRQFKKKYHVTPSNYRNANIDIFLAN